MWLGVVVDPCRHVATTRKIRHMLGILGVDLLPTETCDGYAIVHTFFTEYNAILFPAFALPRSWLSLLLSFASYYVSYEALNGMTRGMANFLHLAFSGLPPYRYLLRGHQTALVTSSSSPTSVDETYEEQLLWLHRVLLPGETCHVPFGATLMNEHE